MTEPYEIGHSPDHNYIYARDFQQPYTVELAFKLAGDMVRFSEGLEVQKCLVDISGTTSVSNVVNKYKFAYEKAPDLGLPHHWRIAFVITQGDKSPDFIETVMKNAGYFFSAFLTIRMRQLTG